MATMDSLSPEIYDEARAHVDVEKTSVYADTSQDFLLHRDSQGLQRA
jgi:hypothetical protein